MKQLWVLTLTVAMLVAAPLAEAKRMGGGSSLGRQSSNVTQRDSATPPATPGAPAQNVNNAAAAKPGGAAAPAAAAAK